VNRRKAKSDAFVREIQALRPTKRERERGDKRKRLVGQVGLGLNAIGPKIQRGQESVQVRCGGKGGGKIEKERGGVEDAVYS